MKVTKQIEGLLNAELYDRGMGRPTEGLIIPAYWEGANILSVVPVRGGKWVLLSVTPNKGTTGWGLVYQFHVEVKYYIEARCVGHPPAEIEGTRTTSHDKVYEMLAALNIGVDQNYSPFAVRKVG